MSKSTVIELEDREAIADPVTGKIGGTQDSLMAYLGTSVAQRISTTRAVGAAGAGRIFGLQRVFVSNTGANLGAPGGFDITAPFGRGAVTTDPIAFIATTRDRIGFNQAEEDVVSWAVNAFWKNQDTQIGIAHQSCDGGVEGGGGGALSNSTSTYFGHGICFYMLDR